MMERHWGEKAHREGIARDACPYTSAEMRRQWQMGWDNAASIAQSRPAHRPEHDERGWQPK